MSNLSRKKSALFFMSPMRTAFTLIEVLVSLAIVAVLSTVVVVTLNPAELMKQARDSNRISDLNTINTALGTYAADVTGANVGASSTVYVSLPSNNSDCSDLGLPALTGGWVYKCATQQNLTKIDGSGWIPVNFQAISFGNPLEKLPVDQKNTTSTGLYYTFVTTGSWWELTAILESEKYGPRMVIDGGASPNAFEQGTQLTLTPLEALDRGVPPSETTPTITSISPTSTYAGDPQFTLTLLGTNFTSSSIVRWGASDKTTSFISDTQITATILAADISATGTVAVTVYDAINGTSGGSNFAINERTQFIAGSWTTDSSGGASQSVGATIAEVAGNFYVIPGNSTTFQKYDPTAKTWTNLASVPLAFGNGASLARYDSNTIYAFRGNNSRDFYKYTISTNIWEAMENVPAATNFGSALAYPGSGDYIYAFKGAGTSDFWRYSVSSNSWGESGVAEGSGASILEVNGSYYITRGGGTTFQKYVPSTRTWSTLAATPAAMSNGGVMTKYSNDVFYVLRGGATNNFWKYTVSSNTWDVMATTTATVNYGGALTYPGSGDYIYAFRGAGASDFWRYSVSSNSWGSESGVAEGSGASILEVNGSYYITRGGGTTFQKYVPSTRTWSTLAATPAAMSNGGVMTKYSNDVFYVLRGGATNNFWKYTVSSNTWDVMATTTATVNYGGALTYPGSGDYIYAFRGAGASDFWRYSIALNTWSALSSAPFGVSLGGHLMTFDSTTLYAFPGNGTAFWKYDIASESWTSRAAAPSSVSCGSSLSSDGTDIYATAGGNSGSFWKYSPGSNSWIALSSAPVNIGRGDPGYCKGGAAYSQSLNKIFAVSGNSNGVTGSILEYNISSGRWLQFAAPFGVSLGGHLMTFDSTTLYAFPGNGTAFWKYDIASESWTSRAAAPSSVSCGSSLSSDGTDIYATAGGNSGSFWKYSPGSNSWIALSSAPVNIGRGDPGYCKGGAAYSQSLNKIFAVSGNSNGTLGSILKYEMSSDVWEQIYAPEGMTFGSAFTALNSTTLYAAKGNFSTSFWKFDILTQVWSAKAASPSNFASGASFSSDGTNIYATAGNSTTFMKYSPGSDSWTTLSSMPASFGTGDPNCKGGIAYSSSLNLIYGVSGNSTSIYKNSP